jgi:hypothetical protein
MASGSIRSGSESATSKRSGPSKRAQQQRDRRYVYVTAGSSEGRHASTRALVAARRACTLREPARAPARRRSWRVLRACRAEYGTFSVVGSGCDAVLRRRAFAHCALGPWYACIAPVHARLRASHSCGVDASERTERVATI